MRRLLIATALLVWTTQAWAGDWAPSAGSVGGRIMPALYFDLTCAGARTACTLLSPTIGGTATFTGPIVLPDGSASNTSLRLSSGGANYGLNWVSGVGFNWAESGTNTVAFIGGIGLGSARTVGWVSTSAPGNSPDLTLGRNGASGALEIAGGTAPTCTGNCGTSPSVTGNNTNMSVTIGTAPPAAANFTVTFNGTLGSAPFCLAQRGTTGTTPVVTAVVTTTTTAVVNLSANLVASELFRIHCFGP